MYWSVEMVSSSQEIAFLDAGRIRSVYSHPNLFETDTDLFVEAFLQFDVELIEQFSYDRIGGSAFVKPSLTEDLSLRFGAVSYRRTPL